MAPWHAAGMLSQRGSFYQYWLSAMASPQRSCHRSRQHWKHSCISFRHKSYCSSKGFGTLLDSFMYETNLGEQHLIPVRDAFRNLLADRLLHSHFLSSLEVAKRTAGRHHLTLCVCRRRSTSGAWLHFEILRVTSALIYHFQWTVRNLVGLQWCLHVPFSVRSLPYVIGKQSSLV